MLTDRATGVVRDTIENTITILAQRKFRNETFTAQVLELHSVDDNDGVVQAALSYFLRSHIELKLGYDRFYVQRAGPFGEFNGNDRLSLSIKIGL